MSTAAFQDATAHFFCISSTSLYPFEDDNQSHGRPYIFHFRYSHFTQEAIGMFLNHLRTSFWFPWSELIESSSSHGRNHGLGSRSLKRHYVSYLKALCSSLLMLVLGILGSASRADFPVSLSNHTGFTPWLLYSSTHHSPEGVFQLSTGWVQDSWH